MLLLISMRSGLKETYGEFPGWMSPDQPGSPLLQLWGCLGALDKTVAEGFCFLPLWAELEERELSLLKDLWGLLQSVELLSPSDSLWPHGLQHTRLPCPSATPRACSNSCPSSWSCHPTISSSVLPFSSLLQSFPAYGSSSMNQFFTSGGQSIGASASVSVLLTNIQDWFPSGD